MFDKNLVVIYTDIMKLVPIYFIVAMFVTMFVLYIVQPDPGLLVKYPSPEEDVSDVYIDDNDVCYRYYRREYTENEN